MFRLADISECLSKLLNCPAENYIFREIIYRKAHSFVKNPFSKRFVPLTDIDYCGITFTEKNTFVLLGIHFLWPSGFYFTLTEVFLFCILYVAEGVVMPQPIVQRHSMQHTVFHTSI